nr:MAG TPA: hypothetical protein [Caudoviricetes sp.]
MPQSHKGGGAYDCVAPCDHNQNLTERSQEQ